MSLFESMSRDLGTVQRVNIQEVRMNKLNFYEYQDDVINSLKESILENGQMEMRLHTLKILTKMVILMVVVILYWVDIHVI